MATYQKVPISDKHMSHRLESQSNTNKYYQPPLHSRNDYSSDSSNDSHTISSSTTLDLHSTQLTNKRSNHFRNRKHIIQIDKQYIDAPNRDPPKSIPFQTNIPNKTKPRFTISRRSAQNLSKQTSNTNPPSNTDQFNTSQQTTQQSTAVINTHNVSKISQFHQQIPPMNIMNSLSVVPSQHEVPPPPPPPQLSETIGNRTIGTNTETGEPGVISWNYAYSYASSDIRSRYGGNNDHLQVDDHKTIDSPNNMVMKRPALINEIQPKTHTVKISETQLHMYKPSLYTGFVTPNPIEIHNDLMRQAKMNGPVLIYRKSFDEGMDMKMNEFNRRSSQTKKELGYIPIFALPVQSVIINCDICLETAFIEMNIVFINNCGIQIKDALFALPVNNGTVRNVCVCIEDNKNRQNGRNRNKNSNGSEKRYIETICVDEDEIEIDHIENNENNDIFDGIFKQSLNEYIPDLFRLPIALIGSHDSIEINVKWEQTLQFAEGRYHLTIPLQFSRNVLPNNVNLSEIIHINVILNSLMSSIKFGSNSHSLSIIKTLYDSKQTHLYATPHEHNIESIDFHIAYYLETNKLNGIGFIECDEINKENGNFVLCINPSTECKNKFEIFSRDIIFLIDRSSSMSSLYSKVIQGISNTLDTLNKRDKFGIICFNETQIFFHGNGQPQNPLLNTITEMDNENEEEPIPLPPNDMNKPKCPLFPANKQYIENAKQFIVNYGATGATDIITPLKYSLQILNTIYNKRKEQCNNIKSIPFIVLITDGSDSCEHEIISYLKQNNENNIRILTLGIGIYCNLYFLKLLSILSGGWNNYAMYGKDIKNKIESLVTKSQAPILKDLSLQDGIVNNKYIQLYPSNGNRINDIFLNGQSIIIYGTYTNNELIKILQTQTNNTIRISAKSIHGISKIYEFKTQIINQNNKYFTIPLTQMCIKSQINELTCKFWFDQKQRHIKDTIIYLSLKYHISSQHISMICCQQINNNSNSTNNNSLKKYQSLSTINNQLNNQNNNQFISIGVTNKLFGNKQINYLNMECGIYNSVGQFINDNINQNTNTCCCNCCNNIYNKLVSFLNSVCCCC